jgi:hypothetical protein
VETYKRIKKNFTIQVSVSKAWRRNVEASYLNHEARNPYPFTHQLKIPRLTLMLLFQTSHQQKGPNEAKHDGQHGNTQHGKHHCHRRNNGGGFQLPGNTLPPVEFFARQ